MSHADPHRLAMDEITPPPASTVVVDRAGETDVQLIAGPVSTGQGPFCFLPGAQFGSYRLLEKLGAGGMGTVYKAVHMKLGKLMAVKILAAEHLQHPHALARFEREMLAVGRLNHPHIVQAFDAGAFQGTHYLAMEYVEGMDLHRLVRTRGPLSVTSAARAVRHAALALDAAHRSGLVHRDIKPSNLLADTTGKVRLLDLGLARLGDETSLLTNLTAAGSCFGTPDYMAPEQWDDSHAVDGRADLYALGCTLHFLLAGHAPFETDSHKTMIRKLAAHVSMPAPDLQASRPSVPAGLAAIYSQLLAKRPADRLPNAAALAEALLPFTRRVAAADGSGQRL